MDGIWFTLEIRNVRIYAAIDFQMTATLFRNRRTEKAHE